MKFSDRGAYKRSTINDFEVYFSKDLDVLIVSAKTNYFCDLANAILSIGFSCKFCKKFDLLPKFYCSRQNVPEIFVQVANFLAQALDRRNSHENQNRTHKLLTQFFFLMQ